MSIPAVLGSLMRLVHSGRSHMAHAGGIEPGGKFVLGLLMEHGPLRSTALAELAYVDTSLVSRQVHSLTAKGFLERIPDPTDGRASLLRITDSGRQFHDSQIEMQCTFFDRVFRDWSDHDRETLEALLTRFVADFNHEFQELQQNQEVRSAHE